LAEEIQLKSIPPSDVSAAQGDLSLLSLRQLIRLRVLHIHFAPGGGCVDSISTIGNIHAAFIGKLDSLLLEQLGREALRGLSGKLWQGPMSDAELRHFGHTLLLTYAVAQSIRLPLCWVCRLGSLRLFFNPASFECCTSFPHASDGVLQVQDSSIIHGRLLQLDWHISLVANEVELKSDAACEQDIRTPRQPCISAESIQATLASLRRTGPQKKEAEQSSEIKKIVESIPVSAEAQQQNLKAEKSLEIQKIVTSSPVVAEARNAIVCSPEIIVTKKGVECSPEVAATKKLIDLTPQVGATKRTIEWSPEASPHASPEIASWFGGA